MYDIGQALGLDKDAARHLGEQLIGEGLLEIVSLSGSVSLTAEGSQAADTGSAPGPAGAGGSAKVLDAGKELGLPGVSAKIIPLDGELRSRLQALTFDLALANRIGSGSGSATAHLTTLAGLLMEPSLSRGTARECLTGAALGLDMESLDEELSQRLRNTLTGLWSDS